MAESFIEGARAALDGQGQQRCVGEGSPKIGQPRPSNGRKVGAGQKVRTSSKNIGTNID